MSDSPPEMVPLKVVLLSWLTVKTGVPLELVPLIYLLILVELGGGIAIMFGIFTRFFAAAAAEPLAMIVMSASRPYLRKMPDFWA